MRTKILYSFISLCFSANVSAQTQKPQELPKFPQAQPPASTASAPASGATTPTARPNAEPDLPVPISKSPTAKPAEQNPAQQTQSGGVRQVPPLEQLDGKAIENIQSQLGAKRPARKAQNEFTLLRISTVESKMTALVLYHGIKTPIVAGSVLGKYKVRDIESDSVCLVDGAKAKKCSKTITFSEGE